MIGVGIGADEVAGVAAADACRLHPAVGGEVGRTEAEALDPRRRGTDRLDVGDAASCLQDGVEEDRPADSGLRFELGDEAVGVVDVLGTLDLGDHDHVEAVTDFGDRGGEVVEHPRRVESVDAGPQLGVAVRPRPCRSRSVRRGPRPCRSPGRHPRGWRAARRPSGRSPEPWPPSWGSTAAGSGSSATDGPGSPAAVPGRRRRAAGRSPWAVASERQRTARPSTPVNLGGLRSTSRSGRPDARNPDRTPPRSARRNDLTAGRRGCRR